MLGDVRGLDVLEYGCGAAQWSVALAADGARVVGLDQSRAQLRHARALVTEGGHPCRSSARAARRSRSPTRPFDVVFCDHGAMSFCDPDRTVPEVARLLRPGGRFVFSHSTPWRYLTWNPKRERVTRRLRSRTSACGASTTGEGTVDFQLPYGEWIRCFRAHGFVVDDLVELRAPEGRHTTFLDCDPRWARRWPAEQIWSLHKEA